MTFSASFCSNTFPSQKQCLKIAQKVAFNSASEASYVYILSGQKFIKNAKNGTKIVETAKIENSNATF